MFLVVSEHTKKAKPNNPNKSEQNKEGVGKGRAKMDTSTNYAIIFV